ncbi:MAG: hypothetical protein IJF39_03740 [Clostridia bacterium]|nr:hypothetical protein [Clostridia bacterium]
MCTCCQNWTNGVGVNSITVSGCNNGSARMGCARTGYGCVQNRSVACGCNCGCHHGCGSRYISFPISGTAVVPTSSIYFYPTSWGNSGCFGGQTNNASNGGCSNGCGFGRCGGAAAIANYYEDYYARQYGLND